MSEQPLRLWAVRMTREEELIFQNVPGRSEEEAIEAAQDRYDRSDDYSVEDSSTTRASAEPEEE